MNSVLQALRQKRLKWVESNRENGFDEGINRLLTELYPDNAHFIYELLQNAEDPEATIVEFELTDNSINFVHNGKRLFSPKDVESITSIGNSTKRDDATTIGKFGVGFKAVFAYTNTPEIHSGEFHFRIHDLVVPDTDNLISCAFDTKKTSFIFPFNNPKKPAQTAISEIRKGLIDLGDNTLLFLNHIREISYKFPSGENGFIQRLDHNNGHIEIKTQHPGQEESISHWLRFTKEIEVIDDDGKQKVCSIAIAYSLVEELDKKSNDKFWKIAPLKQGQVSIYFPAEKETSNLRFHIHAPFASTVARDSVRDCEANYKLRDGIAELVVESLLSIRDQGLLTMGFLEVLPNPMDNLAASAAFYEPIRKAVVGAFKTMPLTPMKSGGYAAANGICIFKGPASISDIVDDNDLVLLLGEGFEAPMWVANPPQKNQREDKFLDSLEIDNWGWSELVETINDIYQIEDRERIENWVSQKNDAWLIRFYALLGEACEINNASFDGENLKIIRVTTPDGDKHVTPEQAFFPSIEGVAIPKGVLIVKSSVYEQGRSENIKRFSKLFLEKYGVKSFDTKELILRKLDFYQTHPNCDLDQYWDDVKLFCEYWFQNKNCIDIFSDKVFLQAKSKDGQTGWFKPSDIYIDKPFADTGLKQVFNQVMLEIYKEELLTEYFKIPNFTTFSNALGIMNALEIKEYLATEMQKDIFEKNGKKTDTTINKDYYINGFSWENRGSKHYIGCLRLDEDIIAISLAIWKTVCRASPEKLKAQYVPSQSKLHLAKTNSSFFIKQLANAAWIPDRDGNFLKPAELTIETLHPDFNFDNANGWLTAIGFGENSKKLSEEYQSKNNKAQEIGFKSAERAAQWAELDKLGFSPDELLAKQKAIEQPEKSVPNPERRRTGIIERSENALTKESVRCERSIQPGIAGVTAEAKAYLRAIYTNKNGEMVCQCCQLEMPFKVNDEYYFEAVQCIKEIDNQHIENRLALCPNCAAMYQYARQTNDQELKLSIQKNSAADDALAVELPIVLRNKSEKIRFVGTHWFDLKTILSS